MSIGQVKALLRRQCEKVGGQAQWARSNGVSAVYVSDVLAGRRGPAGKLLTALSLERVISYRKVKS